MGGIQKLDSSNKFEGIYLDVKDLNIKGVVYRELSKIISPKKTLSSKKLMSKLVGGSSVVKNSSDVPRAPKGLKALVRVKE